jgi:hypothetical protein
MVVVFQFGDGVGQRCDSTTFGTPSGQFDVQNRDLADAPESLDSDIRPNLIPEITSNDVLFMGITCSHSCPCSIKFDRGKSLIEPQSILIRGRTAPTC